MFHYIKNKLATMKKEQALQRLSSLEEETKQLRKIIESEDEPKNIMERVKTFEDACKILGGIFGNVMNETKDEVAYRKLKIMTAALNEGWTPDWNNSNEYKYYPWFNMSSGFGFSNALYDLTYTTSTVGSRLVFKTRALAEYAGKNFESIYKDFLTQ